jgi:hypothetical protein
MISSIASDNNKMPTRGTRMKHVQPRQKPRVYIKPIRSTELILNDPQHRSLHSLADQVSVDKSKSIQSIQEAEFVKLPLFKRMQMCAVSVIHKVIKGFRSVSGSHLVLFASYLHKTHKIDHGVTIEFFLLMLPYLVWACEFFKFDQTPVECKLVT